MTECSARRMSKGCSNAKCHILPELHLPSPHSMEQGQTTDNADYKDKRPGLAPVTGLRVASSPSLSLSLCVCDCPAQTPLT